MTTQDKHIEAKLNLLHLAEYLGNVSEACRRLGCSRDTFYRVKVYSESHSSSPRSFRRARASLRLMMQPQ
jgi:transposase-like protein